MKKFLFLLLATITLMSCQNEFVPEVETDVVGDDVNRTELTAIVNDYRTVGYTLEDGTEKLVIQGTALEWDADLYKAAELQSTHMFSTGEFEHVWSDGTTPAQRVYLYCTYNPVGENIAYGYTNEKSVMNGWLNSEGHRNNMLSPSYNIFAVSRKGNYWTMVLGRKV